jgi:hypothetical protein
MTHKRAFILFVVAIIASVAAWIWWTHRIAEMIGIAALALWLQFLFSGSKEDTK